MLPGVSILVPTFGRTQLLGEVVQSFLAQTYQGPMELVIVNDCPLQTLVSNVHEESGRLVRVVNFPNAFHFGTKRHLLTDLAGYELMCWWDDDDVYLPGFLAALMGKLRPGEPCARLRHMLSWNGDRLKRVSSAVQHAAVIRREAYRSLGGFCDLPAGEADQEFWTRAQLAGWYCGRHHHEADGHLLNIHRAEPDRIHMEGSIAPRISAAQWQAAQLSRIRLGLEPAGVVIINPQWSRPWQGMADAFAAAHADTAAQPVLSEVPHAG